ncbi:unnamed protein product [Sphenostylis stenocarpa]|uniref:Uncharacterized protein n=1 Tax=Sphenostylis stenocarpa TaxID=92480 RepID=A0AA86T7G9_9FABA|nr:unnamed protein product [Sphenostylis stenocarpa]
MAGGLSNAGDTFVDGAVIAAARTLPSWSDGDVPPVPSVERAAVKELQSECRKMLAGFATTSKQDQKLLGKFDIAQKIVHGESYPNIGDISRENTVLIPNPLTGE